MPSFRHPEPLPCLVDPRKQRKLPSLQRPKAVTFSTRLEFIPTYYRSSSKSEDSVPQRRPFPSTPAPFNVPVSTIRRKPVPANPCPAPMRKGTPLHPPHLEHAPRYPCAPTISRSGDHEHFSLPPPEIQAAQVRVRAFIKSEGYRQYVADQRLIESFASANLGVSENRRSQSAHITRRPVPVAPPSQECTAGRPQAVELPAEDVSTEPGTSTKSAKMATQATVTTRELAESPDSITQKEEFSVAIPKTSNQPTTPPRGLRRSPTAHAEQSNLRQKYSLRAELRKVLPASCTSSRRADKTQPTQTTRKNRDPEDWFPPSKYHSRDWKPADQIVNRENEPSKKLIANAKLLLGRS